MIFEGQMWVVMDRRFSPEQVHKEVVEGSITSVYFTPDAAERAAFPTENVWEVDVTVKRIDK